MTHRSHAGQFIDRHAGRGPRRGRTAYHRRYWWLEVVGGGALLGGCLLVLERRIARAAWTLLGRAS